MTLGTEKASILPLIDDEAKLVDIPAGKAGKDTGVAVMPILSVVTPVAEVYVMVDVE